MAEEWQNNLSSWQIATCTFCERKGCFILKDWLTLYLATIGLWYESAEIEILFFWFRYKWLFIILLIVVPLMVAVLFLNKGPVSRRVLQQETLFGITKGKVVDIEPIYFYVQGFDGAKKMLLTNSVSYKYEVNARVYLKRNDIKFIGAIEYDSDNSIVVKYSLNDPKRSLIQLRK